MQWACIAMFSQMVNCPWGVGRGAGVWLCEGARLSSLGLFLVIQKVFSTNHGIGCLDVVISGIGIGCEDSPVLIAGVETSG